MPIIKIAANSFSKLLVEKEFEKFKFQIKIIFKISKLN